MSVSSFASCIILPVARELNPPPNIPYQEAVCTHDICHTRITINFTSPRSAPRLYFPVKADRRKDKRLSPICREEASQKLRVDSSPCTPVTWERACLEGKSYVRLWHPAFLFSPAPRACLGGTGDGDHRHRGGHLAKTPRASSLLGSTLSVGLHPGVPDGYHSVWRALVDGCLPLLYCCGRLWIRAWWLHGTTISASTLDDKLAWK